LLSFLVDGDVNLPGKVVDGDVNLPVFFYLRNLRAYIFSVASVFSVANYNKSRKSCSSQTYYLF
ncbi:MAG TPA: hypothetical protein PLV29_01905, partial [Candidatus Cloacimonas sp.]|nr:hypothetical protein [Candidatus Cloacimonas sp.]